MMTPDTYVSDQLDEQYLPYACRATTADEVHRWQQAFRPVLRRALGLDRIAARGVCPLDPRRIGVETLDDHIREEWTIQTEPGFRVPFYLLLPPSNSKIQNPKSNDPRAPRSETQNPQSKIQNRLPAVLTPHGHSRGGKRIYAGICDTDEDRRKAAEGERDVALQAVREGYIALAPDMRGFAGLRRTKEIEADAANSCLPLQLGALSLGRTLNGDRTWDLIRLLDYLETRPEVDASRIAVTGNSTGGWLSYMLAALDSRIAAAVPSSTMCTYRVNHAHARGCACMTIPDLLTLAEQHDVMGLIAPRPMLIVAGRDDPLGPIDSVEEAYAKLRDIYRAAGAEHRLQLHLADGGHRYYKKPVWPFIRNIFANTRQQPTTSN